MRKAKLIMLLSFAIFPILIWMIAASDVSASIAATVGLTASVIYAAGIAVGVSWLIVMFMDEYHHN